MENVFEQVSYSRHKERIHPHEKFKQWSRLDTVDHWRHARMLKYVVPFLEAYPKSKWLTVGDGRYGLDANFIKLKGFDVLATDIAEDGLVQALEDGLIDKYQLENAEHLSFQDNSFDFVLCKESYHHFPRPAIALYEMIRVCSHGVCLIEPNDPTINTHADNTFEKALYRLWLSAKNLIKKLLNKPLYYPVLGYEPSGNYVYTVSEREFEKACLGINLPCVAFNYLEDCYIEGVETAPATDENELFQEIKKQIKSAERLTAKGRKTPGTLITLILKCEPDQKLIQALKKMNFKINMLSRNPYADSP
jgi:ubiquinone/menaquinone biosynthesis C-methylase UbiE